MRILLLSSLLLIAGCGRPLSENEIAFARSFIGPEIDTAQVRLTRSPIVPLFKFTYPTPPRLTCAQKLFPPAQEKTFTNAPAATVVFNTIHANPQLYLRDYFKEYPDRANILAAMFLAHELVHIWQWQNRDLTGYHPFKAAREHQISADPYLFDLETNTDFLDYGYEQQGAIAGEYICCAALAPDAARTKRLHNMLATYFPIETLTRELPKTQFPLPWKDTDVANLCA